MKKVLTIAALLALSACEKKAPAPAADSMPAAAPAATDSAGMQHDSSMARDSAHTM